MRSVIQKAMNPCTVKALRRVPKTQKIRVSHSPQSLNELVKVPQCVCVCVKDEILIRNKIPLNLYREQNPN